MNGFKLARGMTIITYKWTGIGLVAVALFILILAAFGDRDSLVYRYWARYTSSIERKLRPMFIFTPGRVIAAGQLAAIFVIIVLELTIELPFFPVWLIAVCLLPLLQIESMRRKRLENIERQLDGFLLALANALKAIPSVAAAFNSVVPILQAPMREEVDLACKEMKVGSSLDQALLHMASRIGSRQVDSALSAVLIGRQVGGNLGRVLETTAASIREMARLDGVIRTKTAEGKMQLGVIAVMPFALVLGLGYSSPGYFDPLQQSVSGYVASAMAGGCWIGALLWARKILAVDI
jgi:tight adherence protein B